MYVFLTWVIHIMLLKACCSCYTWSFFNTYLIFSPRTLYQAPPSSALVLTGVVITVQNQAEWTWFREPVLGNKGTSLY